MKPRAARLLLLIPLLASCYQFAPSCLEEIPKRRWDWLPEQYDELLTLTDVLYSEEGPPQKLRSAAGAACKAYGINPLEPEAAYHMARICFWLRDRGEQTPWLDEDCVDFGRLAAEAQPDHAPYQYVYALNLGLHLREASIAQAVTKVSALIETLERVIALDESLDQGGALRTLGLLYLRAPAWPTSVGDIDKALELLETAVERFPEHPLNHLFMAEALIEDERYAEAQPHLFSARQRVDPSLHHWRAARWLEETRALERRVRDEFDQEE